MRRGINPKRGFSLVELVIVVIIMGIIAAIAIPRLASSSGRASETALIANLAEMRKALEHYAIEHDEKYPGSLTAIATYTSFAGAMSGSRSAVYKYGPYLNEIPPLPTGPNKGATGWGATGGNPPAGVSGSPTVGWLYNASVGGVWANDIDHLDK